MSNGKLSYWVRHYEDWKQSGLTQMEYCDENGLTFSEFKTQINEASQKGIIQRTGPDKPTFRSSFVSATVRKSEPEKGNDERGPYCELVFAGRHRVRIDSPDSMGYLRELLG